MIAITLTEGILVAAWIVRKIFDLAFHGMGVRQIANAHEKVPCPGWFQYSRNGGCARFFEGQPDEKRYVWFKTQIKNILKDETYIGNTIHHAYHKCGKYSDYQTRGCTTHYIRYDALYAYMLARIQHWSARTIQDKEKLLSQLLSAGDRERNAAQKKQTAELKKATKRKTEIDGLFVKLYEDWDLYP